jgi:hypothetical protein
VRITRLSLSVSCGVCAIIPRRFVFSEYFGDRAAAHPGVLGRLALTRTSIAPWLVPQRGDEAAERCSAVVAAAAPGVPVAAGEFNTGHHIKTMNRILRSP